MAEFHLSNKNLYLRPREATLVCLCLLYLLLLEQDLRNRIAAMAADICVEGRNGAAELFNSVETIVSRLETEDLESPS